MHRLMLFLLLSFPFVISPVHASEDSERVAAIRAAVESGDITYRLTEPEEIVDLAGKLPKEETRNDGGWVIRTLQYPDMAVFFGKIRDEKVPFTLLRIMVGKEVLDIGAEKKLVLRTLNDLVKIDRFNGFQDVSLVRLDLCGEKALLEGTVFDTLTEWPPAEKLPEGFDPAQLLEDGMKPGLGLAALREEEVDGRGVHVAVIDQPLLLGHEAYTHAILRYDAEGLEDTEPQMHGSPVCSALAGMHNGVAPGAQISFFAVPTWNQDNNDYVRAMKKIFTLNEKAAPQDRIRVVSLSDGDFANQKHYDEWLAVLDRAEKEGMLVVTCSSTFLKYGRLNRIPGTDPDDPENYTRAKYSHPHGEVMIPTGHIAMASHRGEDVYTYEIDGGMSWAAPYIAGLAALAFQVNPALEPKEIIAYLKESVSHTQAGPVVNPAEFIELARP